jgi:hypothetical protein
VINPVFVTRTAEVGMNTLARVLFFLLEGLHVCHCQAENEMGRSRIAQNWAEKSGP